MLKNAKKIDSIIYKSKIIMYYFTHELTLKNQNDTPNRQVESVVYKEKTSFRMNLLYTILKNISTLLGTFL